MTAPTPPKIDWVDKDTVGHTAPDWTIPASVHNNIGTWINYLNTQLGGKQAAHALLAAISALVDPNTDKLIFWDDSAGTLTYLTLGTNLAIVGTTLNATAGAPGSTDAVPEGTVNLYYTNARADARVVAGITGKQALNANLTSISALVDPNTDKIAFWDDSASAWAFLTLGTNLSITGTTLNAAGGSGGTGDVVGPASATDNAVARYDTTTGKLLQTSLASVDDNGVLSAPGGVVKRRTPFPNIASMTVNADTTDIAENTGLTTAVTVNNPTGTPTPGQELILALTGTAGRAITWGTAFEASAVPLPTTTVGTARLDITFRWNTVTSKWRCVYVTVAAGGESGIGSVTVSGTPTAGQVPVAITGTTASWQTVSGGASPFVMMAAPNGTDDTAAIQATINGSAAGSTIWFQPGIYLITAPIVLLPNREYVGSGWSESFTGCVIRQKNAANIVNGANDTGLLVSEAWNTNATVTSEPIRIRNITIDGNRANNATSTACGIIIVNHFSHINDCTIINMPRDGVLVTSTVKNQTDVTNTPAANRIVDCWIENVGRHGIHTYGNSPDGFITDCIFSTCGMDGIALESAIGWNVQGNHLYVIGENGIEAVNGFGTRITGNYVEDFGGNAVTGTWYYGIVVYQQSDWGSHVTDNFVSCFEASTAPGQFNYLGLYARAGATNAHIIATANLLTFAGTPTTKGMGADIDVQSGGVLKLHWADNEINGMNALIHVGAGVNLIQPQMVKTPVTVTSAAVPSINTDQVELFGLTAQAVNITGWTMTGTPGNGQVLLIYIKGTAARTITWPTSTAGSFEAGPAALPTTTTTTQRLDCSFMWNSATSRWRCMATGSA